MIIVKRYFFLYRKDTRVYERFPGREYRLLPRRREKGEGRREKGWNYVSFPDSLLDG